MATIAKQAKLADGQPQTTAGEEEEPNDARLLFFASCGLRLAVCKLRLLCDGRHEGLFLQVVWVLPRVVALSEPPRGPCGGRSGPCSLSQRCSYRHAGAGT